MNAPFLRCRKFLALILFLSWRFSFELSFLYDSGSGLSVHSGTGGSVLRLLVAWSVAVAKAATDVFVFLLLLPELDADLRRLPPCAASSSESSSSEPMSSSSSSSSSTIGAETSNEIGSGSVLMTTWGSTTAGSTTAGSGARASSSSSSPRGELACSSAPPRNVGSMAQSAMGLSSSMSPKLKGLAPVPSLEVEGLKPPTGEPGTRDMEKG